MNDAIKKHWPTVVTIGVAWLISLAVAIFAAGGRQAETGFRLDNHDVRLDGQDSQIGDLDARMRGIETTMPAMAADLRSIRETVDRVFAQQMGEHRGQ